MSTSGSFEEEAVGTRSGISTHSESKRTMRAGEMQEASFEGLGLGESMVVRVTVVVAMLELRRWGRGGVPVLK